MGIGPKIGGIVLPWLVATIFLTLKFKETFSFYGTSNRFPVFRTFPGHPCKVL